MIGDKRIYLSIIFFTILDLLLIVFLILPLFNKIQANSKDIIIQESNLSSLVREAQELRENKDFYNIIFGNLERINDLFIDPKIPIDLINFLEKEAGEAGLSIEILPVTPKVKGEDPWPNLVFQVVTKGSFPNFLKFLDRIEDGPYLLDVLNLKLVGVKEKDKGRAINATFTIKVFTE